MPITDEDAALQAVATLDALNEKQQEAHNSVLRILHGEGAEPFVDVHELFSHYNVLYFRELLLPRVELIWSPRLTLCAGICELTKDNEGKYRRIRMKLSEPLLKYRSRDDTVNTLLHEAIHAYFFITTSWRHSRGDDGTGHGVGFQLLADAINNHGGYEITIYHTFHDEVDSYRTHIWQCDGPCRKQPPYFGLVKRSMNRPPGKSDTWWKRHQEECGGNYAKISEPEPTKQQLKALSAKERAGRQKNKLDGWVKGHSEGKTLHQGSDAPIQEGKTSKGQSQMGPESCIVVQDIVEKAKSSEATHGKGSQKRSLDDINDEDEDEVLIVEKRLLVECPICGMRIAEQAINEHLDAVHPP